MLEYVKTILVKVSFDKNLFEKELRKALASLIDEDINELRRWCYAQFYDTYPRVLERCFVAA